ncbi:MAG: STAS domain-containing protein [Spirochaetes bacterium]|nr:STAS domain-containing protein [Spirochaetota bacterium]
MISISTADHGSLKIVRISGEFFLGHVRQVEDVWNALVADSPETIAIDCGEMTFIDSSAIGTFVKFLNNSMTLGFKLVFFDLNDSIERIFSKAKLNKIFFVLSREDFERLYMKA